MSGLVWLAVVAVLTSLVGAFYYLRVVKLMYFDDADGPGADRRRASTAEWFLSANGLRCCSLGIFPQQLLGLCVIARSAILAVAG